MTEKRRKIIRFAGFALIAAALCVIGYSAYNLISTDMDTNSSLAEAEQMLAEMNAYTGDPNVSLPPDINATQDGSQPDGQALDGTNGDGSQDNSGDISGTLTGAPAAQDSNATRKPGNATGNAAASSTPKPKPKSSALGILVFDSLGGRKVPVMENVSDRDLGKGAAHHPSTSPPGGVGNCVIFGHRNTVFRSFGRLKTGDTIRLEIPGTTYTYKVTSMSVVEPDDKRIFQNYGAAVMTLVTCYPFNFVGAAPQRYIVVAELQ